MPDTHASSSVTPHSAGRHQPSLCAPVSGAQPAPGVLAPSECSSGPALSPCGHPPSTTAAAASFLRNPVTATLENCWSRSQKGGPSKGLVRARLAPLQGQLPWPAPCSPTRRLLMCPSPPAVGTDCTRVGAVPRPPARPFPQRPAPQLSTGPSLEPRPSSLWSNTHRGTRQAKVQGHLTPLQTQKMLTAERTSSHFFPAVRTPFYVKTDTRPTQVPKGGHTSADCAGAGGASR